MDCSFFPPSQEGLMQFWFFLSQQETDASGIFQLSLKSQAKAQEDKLQLV